MGANKSHDAATDILVDGLTERICDSLLSGDTPFARERVEEAARFIIDTALTRKAGEPALCLATASDDRRFMRIAVVNDDMPFLVDSVAAAIAAQGLAIDRLVHPVVPVERDAGGQLIGIGSEQSSAADDRPRESMIYIETPRVDARQRRELEAALQVTLADVRAAVGDWSDMRARMLDDARHIAAADAEGAALLEWLESGMITLLGHLTRFRDGTAADAMGICRKSVSQILADQSYDRAFAWFDNPANASARLPLIVKANRVSKVHRRVPLDLFIVPIRGDGANGKVTALSIHAGVWTSAGLAAAPSQVPRMRDQLQGLLSDLGFSTAGHAGKSLIHALTSLPHDLVIGFSDSDIERVATTMMSLVDRPRPRLALVEAPLSRHLFAFVWLPRDMLSTQVRLQILQLLEEGAEAELLDWSLQVEGGNLAMLRFVLDIRDGDTPPDEDALEERLQAMLRGWGEAVEGELAAAGEAGRAAAIAGRFAEAFPQSYRVEYGAAEAARDIERLRRLSLLETEEAHTPRRDTRLYSLDTDPHDRLRLKIYEYEGSLPLSDAVPALENFGFRVLGEIPTVLDGGTLGTIHDFMVELPEGVEVGPILERSSAIEEAIAAVLNGNAEDDSFNRLVVGTGLSAAEAEWMRAFYRYLRQAGMSFTIYTVVDALRLAPKITRALIDLFVARHDPAFAGDREEASERHREAIRRGLIDVTAINDDRLLRLYNALIDAILRTNAFAPAAEEALGLKIDSAMLPILPKPVPWREIFVYSRRVEGIHLRAGAVARGGIRWSDRRDDFRTEVLGLLKAQRVKNAVIVPTGAKGGFYPKQLPDPGRDREGWAAEGQAAYEVFIRTLLSITDNIVDDEVVHPRDVVIHDGKDPYFVVAADKGTARFSDIANAIAEGRDFWLDDAFASGGSQGYDHKAMGITARGAWMSVQRHFREMGVDVQNDVIRVVGCGDMSGDVFGNGMLLSKTLKLVAAFDHRHIFIDPDPDPARSWQERSRLFNLPRSSWEDYDESLISRGGGVFSRKRKTIELPEEARRVLGVEQSEIDPESLISAILKAPVDLLWFGGIGTYIKASTENNVDVGDPANDALRVDGRELRTRVIGEGANLGVTQAGRIEFALSGGAEAGRINTDFIDNSAGVDCSDNEVNIKIALAAACRSGELDLEDRNQLLVSMTDEVAALVLEDNRLQALALSIARIGGAQSTAAHLRLIETLEDRGALDRRTEGLADNETLTRRAADGSGLTRPELAVLLSSTKLVLQDAIEQSDLSQDAFLEGNLLRSFPEPMREAYRPQIEGHRLRTEIIATDLANRMINRLGLVHPFELAEEEGATLAQVASAFVCAERLFSISDIWRALDDTEMPETARLMLFDRVATAMRSQMADLLRAGAGIAPPSQVVAALNAGIEQLAEGTSTLLAAESRQQSARMRAELVQHGAPEPLAARVAHMFDMDGAVGLVSLARDTGIDVRRLTQAFTDLGGRLGLDWAQVTATLMTPSDVWERLLVSGLARDFQQMRLEFLRRLAIGGYPEEAERDDMDPVGMVKRWASEHAEAIDQFRSVIARAQKQAPVAPSMLAQIASQARNLLGR